MPSPLPAPLPTMPPRPALPSWQAEPLRYLHVPPMGPPIKVPKAQEVEGT